LLDRMEYEDLWITCYVIHARHGFEVSLEFKISLFDMSLATYL